MLEKTQGRHSRAKFHLNVKHILRLVNYYKNTITSFYLDVSVSVKGLHQKVCSIPLPVLATIVMRRGKNSVVRVACRVAPLIPVHLNMFIVSAYGRQKPQFWTNFDLRGGGGLLHRCPFTDEGQIWCAIADPRCALMCQISHRSVYSVASVGV